LRQNDGQSQTTPAVDRMDVFHGDTLCWITKRFSVMSVFSINTSAPAGIDPDHGARFFFQDFLYRGIP
jgi:hypothetical protein